MKKAISLFLVFSILLLSGNGYAKEKKGATLIIQKKDGTRVKGELIAVKENSIILLERRSGVDITLDTREIYTVRIYRNSWFPASLGLISGIAIGVEVSNQIDPQTRTFMDFAPFFALLGISMAGLTVGLVAGADTTFQIEGKSKSEVQDTLEKLRKKARVKNSQ